MADTLGFVWTPAALLGVGDPIDYSGLVMPPPVVPQLVAPAVTNVSPAQLTELAPGALVAFDVTDDTGVLAIVVVLAYFQDSGAYEVVHDGAAFAPQYETFSTRSVIAYGYHFAIAREDGWPEAPRIRIIPVDMGGNIP